MFSFSFLRFFLVYHRNKYILRKCRPTYIASTVGLTAIVFVTGCLSWWTPTLVEHSWAMHHGTSVVTDDVKAR